MYLHVGEAFIPVRGASCVADRIYRKLTKYGPTAHLEGLNKSVDFEDGGAIIHSTNNGLILQIFARDVLTFHGIRTLIEGGLPKAIFHSVESVEWLLRKAGPQPAQTQ